MGYCVLVNARLASINFDQRFEFSDSAESGSNNNSNRDVNRSGSGKVASDGKPTRVRTVLNEKQLHMLRTCYAANPRPDALMKEQLVERTGLSPRVIRVWFQNKRCKDKKRAIAMKQQMQHEKPSWGGDIGYATASTDGQNYFTQVRDTWWSVGYLFGWTRKFRFYFRRLNQPTSAPHTTASRLGPRPQAARS
ncbi:Insulin protein enhancer protein isl-1 [Sarracenia purpurea var. burkii]